MNAESPFDLERIIGYDALYESMMKCRKGVMWKDSTASFVLNGVEKTMKLSAMLHSEAYKPTTSSRTESSEGNMGIAITRAGTLSVRDERFSTAEDFKTAMGNVLFTFALAEPVPFHVDPQAINSLEGTNTMWTDAQNLEVTYRSI